jgi:SAM-dependent methyltransferase
VDELPRLEGTLCCSNCGQAFAARGGVLDMVPALVETTADALRRRLESPPVAKFYEEHLRHFLTPLTSSLQPEQRDDWLSSHEGLAQNQTIVDLGCGRGMDLDVMAEAAQPRIALGIDASKVLLAEAARQARAAKHRNRLFLRARLEDLPLGQTDFAWANCYGVLHRLAEPDRVVRQLVPLLQPGGRFTCLTTLRLKDTMLSWGQRALAACAQVHLFASAELREQMEEAGLEIKQLKCFESVVLIDACRRIEA